jgi:hypothetical protein
MMHASQAFNAIVTSYRRAHHKQVMRTGKGLKMGNRTYETASSHLYIFRQINQKYLKHCF